MSYHDEEPVEDLCTCGHARSEHSVREFVGMEITTCLGHTVAYPLSEIGEDRALEVACRCDHFEKVEHEHPEAG